MIQIALDTYLKKNLPVDPQGKSFTCDWCGFNKPKMTIWKHFSGVILCLCFMGCQNFPEPYKKAISNSDRNEWERIDRFQDYKKKMNFGCDMD